MPAQKTGSLRRLATDRGTWRVRLGLRRDRGNVVPRKSVPDPLAELEKTQEKLRENIEESKQLVVKAQDLIQKAKDGATKD